MKFEELRDAWRSYTAAYLFAEQHGHTQVIIGIETARSIFEWLTREVEEQDATTKGDA